MNLLTPLLILSTFDLIFCRESRLVYVNQNLTFMAAWTRCHEKYKGQLANLDKWTYTSQMQQTSCFEANGFFWHGSIMKTLPWISFEESISHAISTQDPKIRPWAVGYGCYIYSKYSKSIRMPYKSLAWCQNQCMFTREIGTYFAIEGNQCFCSVDTLYVQVVVSTLCNIPCDENAMCGGDGYISLYKKAQQRTVDVFDKVKDVDYPEDIDKQCLFYKCTSRTKVATEAAKCTDPTWYICENKTGQFQSPRREPWLTSNMLCTRMLRTPTCRNVTLISDLRRWTNIFRVQDKFKDEVSMTITDIQRFLNSSFYTSDRKGRHIFFSDGLSEYPSVCESDISVEQLIDEDQVCSIPSGTEKRKVSSTESSMETTNNEINIYTDAGLTNPTDQSKSQIESANFDYGLFVILGASILALMTSVGFVTIYWIVKCSRQQRDMSNIEMQIRAPRTDGIFSGPTLADISSAFSNVNASDVERISSTNNPHVCSIINRDRMTVSEADNPGLHSKPINDCLNGASSDNVETVYNEVGDVLIGNIESGNLTATNYVDDGGYTEIGLGQTESETGYCEQSLYSENSDRVYETVNIGGMDNVYEHL